VHHHHRQVGRPDRHERVTGLGCGVLCPGSKPRADGSEPANTFLPVLGGVHGDSGVLGAPAGALPYPLAEAAQREMQARQVTATLTALTGILGSDGFARHIACQAVPAVLPGDRFADRHRDNPAGAGEMAEHRVLVAEILPRRPGVIAAQHEALLPRRLDKPVPVPQRDILESDDPVGPQAEQIKDLVRRTGHRHHRWPLLLDAKFPLGDKPRGRHAAYPKRGDHPSICGGRTGAGQDHGEADTPSQIGTQVMLPSIPGGLQTRAMDRLLDYYQHTAALAQARLARQTRPGVASALPTAPTAAPALDDAEQALAWLRTDRANLLACLDYASHADQHARVIALTAALAGLLWRDGRWTEAVTRHLTAIMAAQHLDDRFNEACALNELASVRLMTDDFPGAARDLERALALYRDLGNQLGQANTLSNLGTGRRLTDDYAGAIDALEQALALYLDLGNRLGQANIRSELGMLHLLTGKYPEAARCLEQALALYRDLGNRLGEGNTLNELGIVLLLTGDYPGAARSQKRALALYRDLGDRLGEANALSELGIARRATGNYPEAARYLEEALALYRDLGDRLGEANALSDLGIVRRLTGDYLRAVRDLEESLALSRELGIRLGQANALSYLGTVRGLMNDYPGAARDLENALALYRDLGDRGGEAEALNERGVVHLASGEIAQAADSHRKALELADALGSVRDQASALAGLGRCAIATSYVKDAQALLLQALEMFQRIGAADATSVLADLKALTSSSPTG
jgi:tetratricopeptide (TPR) repeat protein